MKQIIYILIFVFSANIYSQTKLYVHPDGDNYAANTETIALLPLKVQVKLRPKQLKDFTPEQIVEMQEAEAIDIQRGMYSWFLKRKQSKLKKRTKYLEVKIYPNFKLYPPERISDKSDPPDQYNYHQPV